MRYTVLILILIFNTISYSQFKNVKINTLENQPNEVSIAINPLNPQNLIAGANINNYYYSFDGGITWTNKTISSSGYGVWGDPCVIFDIKGNSYFLHLSRPPNSTWVWIDRIVCQKSEDGGMSWSEPGTYMGLNNPKHQDKEWACFDPLTNRIYVTWTQFDLYGSRHPLDSSNILFSSSSDFGLSWSDAIRINQIAGTCIDSANTVEGAVPCAGKDGQIYVSWSGPVGIVFDRSYDGGKTWLGNDIPVSDQVGGWDYDIEGVYRCNGLPVTACDISSGLYAGTIYINFSDHRNGRKDTDIFLVKSTDGGNTWSKVKRVNDDAAGSEQFMSWMSVDPLTGAVNILYYDRRSHYDFSTDVYLSRSTDGGESFVNMKVSEEPFQTIRNVFMGDYVGVASHNDFVACSWTRIDGGKTNIIYCGIDFKK
ncbi:MAG: sialidase family protein [Ignavibacteria bacterium]